MKNFIVSFFLIFSFIHLFSQKSNFEDEYRQLEQRGEIYIVFPLTSGFEINFLSSFLSVDKVKNDSVYAYLNKKQFENFLHYKIPFRLLTPPSLEIKARQKKSFVTGEWDYLSYPDYIQKMKDFAGNNPVCSLVKIGESIKGKEILAVKISDNVNMDEEEPEVFYSAGIHGDEGSGVVLMLKLIDYILSEYQNDERITTLVDKCEIYINPLSNPDGFYFLSDSSNFGSTRFNSENVDLNRNFPDAAEGDHPDGNDWQQENIVMMDFMKKHHFILSANFHDGAEVVNYPWDTWERLHADDEWFEAISREYADTVHKYSSNNYFTFLNNGITNGYAWYSISGGRQDYVTYFLNGREVTIELSETKSQDGVALQQLWEYNKNSMINYLNNSLHGMRGYIKDAYTGSSLEAVISLADYDKDNSQVMSFKSSGEFYRMVQPGDYTLQVDAEGYERKIVNATVPQTGYIDLNIEMVRKEGLIINPVYGNIEVLLNESYSGNLQIEVFDLSGRIVFENQIKVNAPESFTIDISSVSKGFYILRLRGQGITKEYKFNKN